MAIVKAIRLEKWVTSKSLTGNNTEAITEKYNLFAEVKRSGGARLPVGGLVVLTETIEFRVRFRPNFKPTGNWRVVYDGKRYTISSIEKENENRFFWILKADTNGV